MEVAAMQGSQVPDKEKDAVIEQLDAEAKALYESHSYFQEQYGASLAKIASLEAEVQVRRKRQDEVQLQKTEFQGRYTTAMVGMERLLAAAEADKQKIVALEGQLSARGEVRPEAAAPVIDSLGKGNGPWLLPPAELVRPSASEVEEQVWQAPEVYLARGRLESDARKVYASPKEASWRLVTAASAAESADELRSQIRATPEAFGELRGTVGLFGKNSEEREGAIYAVAAVARDAWYLTVAGQSARRDLERSFGDEQRRASVGVPEPSAELSKAFKLGAKSDAYIGGNPELREEVRRLDAAINARFTAEDRADFHDGQSLRVADRYKIAPDTARELQSVAVEVAAATRVVQEASSRVEQAQGSAKQAAFG